MELVTHAYLNVNARPKQMVVLTKSMDTADLTEHIKVNSVKFLILILTYSQSKFELDWARPFQCGFNEMKLDSQRAFEPTEVPLEKSLFRLYCRNATPNLRSLIRWILVYLDLLLLIHSYWSLRQFRSILAATVATPGLEVEYTDILGEVCYKGSVSVTCISNKIIFSHFPFSRSCEWKLLT